ncbi:hypothetical protein DFP72DRAFT_913626, partial [Ephemerocybe angulata]
PNSPPSPSAPHRSTPPRSSPQRKASQTTTSSSPSAPHGRGAPASSSSAFAMPMGSTALIMVLETVPTFPRVSTRVWIGMEAGLAVVYTVEYHEGCVGAL